MANVYALGAVKPWVRTAADLIGNQFDVATIYGVGARANESDHPKGLALDFMVNKDTAKGNQIAAFVAANKTALGVTYYMWQQAIDTGSGLKKIEDRGSDTANHKDHVHVSFEATAPSGNVATTNAAWWTPNAAKPYDPSKSLAENLGWGQATGVDGIDTGVTDITNALTFLSDASNWWRVFLFVLGGAMLTIVLYQFVNSPAKSALAKVMK